MNDEEQIVDKEFAIDLSNAAPLNRLAELDQLSELLSLRSCITDLQRATHASKVAFEGKEQTLLSDRFEALRITVWMVDELRRLLYGARGADSDQTSPSGSWFSRFCRRLGLGSEPAPTEESSEDSNPSMTSEAECLSVFDRLCGAAVSRLDSLGVENIPLLAVDLTTLRVRNQSVTRFVDVLGRETPEASVVIKELRGLWVLVNAGTLVPVQRGQVMLA